MWTCRFLNTSVTVHPYFIQNSHRRFLGSVLGPWDKLRSLELPGWLRRQHLSSFQLMNTWLEVASVLLAMEVCKRWGSGCHQGRFCGEMILLHWVLTTSGRSHCAGGQCRGPSSDVTYYQPSSRPQRFLSAFPLDMTDSANKGSSCLSGAIPGPGAPTPCCRGCGALIKETAEAQDSGQRGRENRKEGRWRAGRRTGTSKPCPSVPLGWVPAFLHLVDPAPSRPLPFTPRLRLHSFITRVPMASIRADSSLVLTEQVSLLPLTNVNFGIKSHSWSSSHVWNVSHRLDTVVRDFFFFFFDCAGSLLQRMGFSSSLAVVNRLSCPETVGP